MIDLLPIIQKQTGPLKLPTDTYTLASTTLLKYPLDGNNSTLVLPTNCTNFRAAAPEVVVSNFIVPKAGVFFEAAGNHCGAINCKLGIGQPNGSVEQAFKSIPGGTNPYFSGNEVGVTTTVSVYLDQSGAWVSQNTLNGSINEYALRLEVGGANGSTMQSGATITGNTISNHNGCKDAIGVRWFQNVTLNGNTIVGDIRWGQVPGAGTPATNAVGQWASGSMTLNHITSNGMSVSLVECYQGVKLSLTGNTFSNPLAPPVCTDVFSEVTSSGNTVQICKGSKAWEYFAASSKGKLVSNGTDKTITITAPA